MPSLCTGMCVPSTVTATTVTHLITGNLPYRTYKGIITVLICTCIRARKPKYLSPIFYSLLGLKEIKTNWLAGRGSESLKIIPKAQPGMAEMPKMRPPLQIWAHQHAS